MTYTDNQKSYATSALSTDHLYTIPHAESILEPGSTPRLSATRDFWILFGTFLLLAGAVLLAFELQPYYEQLRLEKLSSFWGRLFVVISFILLAARIGFLLFMGVKHFQYKPVESVSDELLPSCTVIVPAYNEGAQVWETLMSLAKSDYPLDKLQLIAIDDGSKDDTWEWIKKAKEVLGARLAIHQQPKNKGKRHALYHGFTTGSGEIFVTVDSDSIVKKDTLRNLVSPFVVNPKCGAVAGNVKVLNGKAVIPKMVRVSFAFSFEFIRSAQSTFGSVLCTPGALSAYRRSAVLSCLPRWINQKFMGKASDIGEDRAMTNMIMQQGYHILFQRNAHVLTNVPEAYKNLYKMYIRWERSNVRENIMMSKFAFTKFREGSTIGTRVLLVNQWLKTVIAYPMTLLMIAFILMHPLLFICSSLVGILIFSSVQVIFYGKRHRFVDAFWAYPYSLLYTFALFWVTPYAIATAGRSGWLTRTLPQGK